MKTLGFIGGGRITRILLNGFMHSGIPFTEINVYDTNEEVLHALKVNYPQVNVSNTDPAKAASSDWVFFALHPPVLMNALLSNRASLKKDALVISLAPKITLEKIQQALKGFQNIARMNPNAGTFAGKGYNPVCFIPGSDRKTMEDFLRVFEKVGKVPVIQEPHIEAYAMISAMAHTCFWFQLQQLKELGVSYGLSENAAQEAISAMLRGTSETLFHSGLAYEEVVDLVPIKPLAEHEHSIREHYKSCLNELYVRIKP